MPRSAGGGQECPLLKAQIPRAVVNGIYFYTTSLPQFNRWPETIRQVFQLACKEDTDFMAT